VGEVSRIASWRGVNGGGFDSVDKLWVDKVFFLTRLPPRFEVPRIHSRFSFLHRAHGGWPPDASLPDGQSVLRWMRHKTKVVRVFADGGNCSL
jgi:hypothetical protein